MNTLTYITPLLCFCSFSEDSSMVALDAEKGNITLTSDLSEVTEDTLLNLTAIATDHGTPPKSDEGLGLVCVIPVEILPLNQCR